MKHCISIILVSPRNQCRKDFFIVDSIMYLIENITSFLNLTFWNIYLF